MKVIRKHLIEAAQTCTDFKSKYNMSAFNEDEFFGLSLLFFETADLRIYRGYFLAICQLCYCISFRLILIGIEGFR